MVLQGIVSLAYLIYGIYLCFGSTPTEENVALQSISEEDDNTSDQFPFINPPDYDYRYQLNPAPAPVYFQRPATPIPTDVNKLWDSCQLEYNLKNTTPSHSLWKKHIQQRLCEVQDDMPSNPRKTHRLRTNEYLSTMEHNEFRRRMSS